MPRERAMEVRDRRAQLPVPRSLLDHLVEDVVRALPLVLRRPRLRSRARLPLLDLRLDRMPEQQLRLVQEAELLVRDVRRRKLGGQALELRAHEVRLADFMR